jgi:transcriptional regulator with XRE-family HTH domain
MAARKKTGAGRKPARATQRKKTVSKQTRGKTATPRGKTAGGGTRRPARRAASAKSGEARASLADRLTELVEHAAAGALRLVVEGGGREIAGWLPEAAEMRREAGAYLRELREVAGLTLDELADAAELGDRSLIEAVENGTASLSFELILRLAAILARHDPVPFVSHMLRTYNPVLWQLLEDWGIGRLPLQLAREREFVNVLRGHDEARTLSDVDFARVLEFTRVAFEMSLEFATQARKKPRRKH